MVAAGAILATVGSALAHNDPPGCSATGVSIEVRVFRMDGITGVVGSVSQCEDINYQVVIKKSSAAACAFGEGTLTLTLPDGSMNQISGNVPCIGGTTSPCDPTVTELDSALIPYTIKTTDIHSGFILATAIYTGGVAHDNEPDTPGVGANTPKQTPAVLCTDNNACTNDFCDSTKAGAAACSHTAVVCEDNNACTSNVCDPASGTCSFPVAVTCNDNNACTTDSCNTTTGLCEVVSSVTCNDNNACTTDTCNPATGLCVFTPTGINCDDNNACTVDSCNTTTGTCDHVDNVTPTCNDNNQCTTDSCNTTTGLCQHIDDVTPTCNDNNQCTTDSCNTTTGLCDHVDNVTPTCNDNNQCTADSCNTTTGLCQHIPSDVNCDDGNACTTDSCNTTTGTCDHVDNVTPTCNDNNQCTVDSCNPTTGLCQHIDNVTPTCNDNNACTQDSCNTTTGLCQHVDLAPNCDDNNVCTIDSCNTTTGLCDHVPTNGPGCGQHHYQCYEIKPFNFARVANVSVQDRFGSANVVISTPHPLCAPSDKRGEDPAAVSDPAHLVGYVDRGAFTRVLNQTVTNQFGTVKVDVVRRTHLLVPSSKSLVSQPPPLPPGTLDHFQCYLVKRSIGAPRFVPVRGVGAEDQFGSHAVDLLRPRYLCVPANKQNEDPTAPSHPGTLLCYKARHPGRFGTDTAFINNQFGPLKTIITRRIDFCVPSTIGLD
jgi:hypothetical protein